MTECTLVTEKRGSSLVSVMFYHLCNNEGYEKCLINPLNIKSYTILDENRCLCDNIEKERSWMSEIGSLLKPVEQALEFVVA